MVLKIRETTPAEVSSHRHAAIAQSRKYLPAAERFRNVVDASGEEDVAIDETTSLSARNIHSS